MSSFTTDVLSDDLGRPLSAVFQLAYLCGFTRNVNRQQTSFYKLYFIIDSFDLAIASSKAFV